MYVYGRQTLFINESDEFIELFEFNSINLQANKSYIVQFSMPYELTTNGIYSESMGEMVLCLKANSKAWPIQNSFYQNKTANLSNENKNVSTYRTTSGLETSFLNSARFRDLTTQSIPTTYNNDLVFYKHSQAIVYKIIQ